jgi:ubiquinone/menaquinone biosynthesis C-methylase UbiE
MKCFKYHILASLLVFLLVPKWNWAQSGYEEIVTEEMDDFIARDYWQRPDILLNLMDIQPTEIVADLGCGTGYFSIKLADRVGPDGEVIALDIDKRKLQRLKLLKRYGGLDQLKIVHSSAQDAQLTANSYHKIVLLNTYHEIEAFEEILEQCKRALKPEGKIYIIDKVSDKMDNDKTSRKKLVKNHYITRSMVEEELKTSGFIISKGIDKYLKNGTDRNVKKMNWFIVVASVE